MAGSQRRGLVVGGGGTLGFAWAVAALAAVEEQLDWDARTAEVLVGTSAGAEVVCPRSGPAGRSPTCSRHCWAGPTRTRCSCGTSALTRAPCHRFRGRDYRAPG